MLYTNMYMYSQLGCLSFHIVLYIVLHVPYVVQYRVTFYQKFTQGLLLSYRVEKCLNYSRRI